MPTHLSGSARGCPAPRSSRTHCSEPPQPPTSPAFGHFSCPSKDDEARGWYEALEFEPSPTDPYHLFLLMKDLRAMLSH